MRRCLWCGKNIEKEDMRHGNQKYHTHIVNGNKEPCSVLAKRERIRLRQLRFRWRWKDLLDGGAENRLGTGWLHEHREDDPDDERRAIMKEFIRLRLRK